jgi:formylglycine-generating enzyme required for sulfatase activity
VRVTVANPARLDLRLMTGSGAGASEVSAPGRAASWTAALQAGKYWLSDPSLGPLCALPLLPGALGAAELSVVVEPPQPSSDAWACIPAGPSLLGDEIGVGQEDERPHASRWSRRSGSRGARSRTPSSRASSPSARRRSKARGWPSTARSAASRATDRAGRFTTDAPDLPVVTVSLAGALAYCEWLTRATGVVHRLPTEVEWEKAARGPGSCVYAFGNVYERGKANAESGALAPVARSPRTAGGSTT